MLRWRAGGVVGGGGGVGRGGGWGGWGGGGRDKLLSARVARTMPANVEKRQNNFFKKKLAKCIQGWKSCVRIHFMVKQQTT